MAKTVLVVEDEAIVRESLKDWLTEVGYSVAVAEDGEQALELVKREKFGVMVVDLKLPGKDGIQVIREARGDNPELQAIMITAYPSPET
ncbi:MAG: response regulator, partial [Dehalococcoidia bacterium]|nr:response regulator [Dehalococcoidia bacterium]